MCAGSINYKSDSWTYTEKIWNRKGYTPQIWEAQIAHCKFGSEKKICQLFPQDVLTEGEDKASGCVVLYHINWRLLIVDTEKPLYLSFQLKKVDGLWPEGNLGRLEIVSLPASQDWTSLALHLPKSCLQRKWKMPLFTMLSIAKVELLTIFSLLLPILF